MRNERTPSACGLSCRAWTGHPPAKRRSAADSRLRKVRRSQVNARKARHSSQEIPEFFRDGGEDGGRTRNKRATCRCSIGRRRTGSHPFARRTAVAGSGAAWTIEMIAALNAAGSVIQRSTTSCKSGSAATVGTPSLVQTVERVVVTPVLGIDRTGDLSIVDLGVVGSSPISHPAENSSPATSCRACFLGWAKRQGCQPDSRSPTAATDSPASAETLPGFASIRRRGHCR